MLSSDSFQAERARRSLSAFIRLAWPIVEPAMPLLSNWHIDAVSEHLEAVTKEQIRKLLINIPPGHAKSLLVSVIWPAWIWATNPAWRGLFSAYAGDLATRDSIKCRTLIESEWYQQHYAIPGGWGLTHDSNRKDEFTNSKSGFRKSLSVGGKATGFRGNAVVVDDPLNAKEAPSKTARDEAIYWWDRVMSSRLNDLRRGAKVIIMQRLHEEDLSGHVLAQTGYEHLCLPSEFDPARRSKTFYVRHPVALSHEGPESEPVKFWEDPRTEKDELLFPTLFPDSVLTQAKVDLTPDGYAGQHGQVPVTDGGSMFQAQWWQRWKGDNRKGPHPGAYETWAGSMDCAFKDKSTSDFVVLQVWARARANRYLIWQFRGRLDFVGTCAMLKRVKAMFPQLGAIYVEDAANGTAVLNSLRDAIEGLIPVATGPRSKEARAHAVLPFVCAGNVWIPEDGAGGWEGPERDGDPVKFFIHEHTVFPKGKNDDQVDATTQLLERWRQSEFKIYPLKPKEEARGVTM